MGFLSHGIFSQGAIGQVWKKSGGGLQGAIPVAKNIFMSDNKSSSTPSTKAKAAVASQQDVAPEISLNTKKDTLLGS